MTGCYISVNHSLAGIFIFLATGSFCCLWFPTLENLSCLLFHRKSGNDARVRNCTEVKDKVWDIHVYPQTPCLDSHASLLCLSSCHTPPCPLQPPRSSMVCVTPGVTACSLQWVTYSWKRCFNNWKVIRNGNMRTCTVTPALFSEITHHFVRHSEMPLSAQLLSHLQFSKRTENLGSTPRSNESFLNEQEEST